MTDLFYWKINNNQVMSDLDGGMLTKHVDKRCVAYRLGNKQGLGANLPLLRSKMPPCSHTKLCMKV